MGIRFAAQQTIRPGIDDHFLPGDRARVRAAGGVRFGLTDSNLRTDYSYHALSAMVQALRYFDDDDWPIESPPRSPTANDSPDAGVSDSGLDSSDSGVDGEPDADADAG